MEDGISSVRQKARNHAMVLVTGGSGYIGSHIVLELLLVGFGVIVVDNLSNSHWESLVRVHWLAQEHYAKRDPPLPKEHVPPLYFHEVDICDKEGLRAVFETWKTDESGLVPAQLTKSSNSRRVKRSTPIDIGQISLRQRFCCKDFSNSRRPLSIKLNHGRSDGQYIRYIVHLAGLKSVSESLAKPLAYYRNNVGGLLNLLELMDEYLKVKRIVFSSSATVYGTGNETTGITEDAVEVGGESAALTNPYGRTKWTCEEILNEASSADPELTVIAMRYFNPTGAHPSGLIGEDPKGIPNNIIPVVVQTYQGRRRMVPVYGSQYNTPDGTGVRDYIHVVDVAKGHVAAICKLSQISDHVDNNVNIDNISTKRNPNYLYYNLGTGRGYSVLEILNTFSSVCGKDIPFVMSDARAGDLGTVTADVTKAATELGWHAELGLEEMCRDVFQWAINNPRGYEPLVHDGLGLPSSDGEKSYSTKTICQPHIFETADILRVQSAFKHPFRGKIKVFIRNNRRLSLRDLRILSRQLISSLRQNQVSIRKVGSHRVSEVTELVS